MQNAHQSALTAKHMKLDQQISSEAQRPLPDQMLIAQLKKEKLRLKEELGR
ncbi:YdcH family protein [Sphingomonas xinjiangensis]|uniref:DUF465 domain-containing protein n=1 Tax=Sphingomonas xinjiangensis TaxID=643568 RepID=A0A840YDZ5_9SPHN|nr:YdcH family protein [Sphingomonas xinjiangensis]MBB5709008.1 hypothetical protein [Sphingomonas xinjiangensis]